ncbi:MAG: AraC family transcriptional regulator [Gammaproteobacteria bacterium]|nr:AraC family transcriptional regulator [Gammaproteobacteria bacterium]
MHPNFTLSSLNFRHVLTMAQQADYPIEKLCHHLDIQFDSLNDLDYRLPTATLHTLLETVAKETQNEYFWLSFKPANLIAADNPLFYFVFNSRDGFVFSDRAQKFYGYVSDAYYPIVIVQGDESVGRVVWREPAPPLTAYRLDWLISLWWSNAVNFFGPDYKLTAIRLTTEFSDRKQAYEDFFQVPVYVNHAYNEFVGPASNLTLPNQFKEVDANLDHLLLRYLQKKSVLPHDESLGLREKLRAQLQKQFLHGQSGIEVTAKNMGMSTRTLQRKLAELDTSFGEELDRVRRDLALRYLKQDNLRIVEIAFLLGFDDVKSVNLAFRRWFGSSPTEYRKRLTAELLPENSTP